MNYWLFPETETTTAPETLTSGDKTDMAVAFAKSGLMTVYSYLTRNAQIFSYPKPLPVIVEFVPPLIGPIYGKTDQIVGC